MNGFQHLLDSFCWFLQAQGSLPELCKSKKGKKSLIPRAIEDRTFLMGFSTPVGNALRVRNSERLRAAGTGFIHHFWLC